MTISLPTGPDCADDYAVCTADGRKLIRAISAEIPMEGATESSREESPLTATFSHIPTQHNNEQFRIRVSFSEEISIGFKEMRDHAFDVTNGRITKASRTTRGSNQGWLIIVVPEGETAITLPGNKDCDEDGAVCTSGGRQLTADVNVVVPRLAAPTDLVASVRSYSIALTWTAPEDDTITGFQIERRRPTRTTEREFAVVHTTEGGVVEWEDEDTASYTEHVYRVAALDEDGDPGTYSEEVTVTTRLQALGTVAFGAGGNQVIADRTLRVWVNLNSLKLDYNEATLDVVLRVNVEDSEGENTPNCEGTGMNQDHNFYTVNSSHQVKMVEFGGLGCVVGDYEIVASITDGDGRHKITSSMSVEVTETWPYED